MTANDTPQKDTEVKVDENGNKERETYTAKQVATRIGTDAKTLRKFFRSPASTVEAVGQGGRYEFDKADLPKIKEEFNAWQSNKTPRTPKKEGPKESRSPRELEVDIEDEEEIELEDDPELNFEDEPSPEELDELESEEDEDDDIELDDEEDDEEDDEDGHTEVELKAMTLPKLRTLAESDYDLDIKGMKKADIVQAILKHEAGN